MNRLKYGALLCGLAVFGVAGCSRAAAATTPIVVETLSPRAAFTDDVQMQLRIKLDGQQTQVINLSDPSRVVTARITMQPGAIFPWHTHAGPVIVTVTQGELTYVRGDDCVPRMYPAGTVFVDPGQGTVHTAFNSAGPDVVTVLHATFFDAPDAPGPLTIPADPPADCDIAAGAHTH
jgi:quercetin dioxygenase-like cupin family protein